MKGERRFNHSNTTDKDGNRKVAKMSRVVGREGQDN